VKNSSTVDDVGIGVYVKFGELFARAHGIIFVLDASDASNFEECRKVFEEAARHALLCSAASKDSIEMGSAWLFQSIISQLRADGHCRAVSPPAATGLLLGIFHGSSIASIAWHGCKPLVQHLPLSLSRDSLC
jgi:hypothetical protein